MEQTAIRKNIREYILSHHLAGEAPENLKDDMPLVSSSILDSLSTFSFVTFLENEYGIELDVFERSVEKFDTIDDFVNAVEGKIK
jgi:acyl carrier protein